MCGIKGNGQVGAQVCFCRQGQWEGEAAMDEE